MLRIGIDSETPKFDDACMTPPGVCMSYAEIIERPGGYSVARRGVLSFRKGPALDVLLGWLHMAARGEALIVGANIAYEVFSSIVSAFERSVDFGNQMFRAWIEAYDNDGVEDVFLRQKLLDLASGCYRFDYETKQHFRYNLAGLSQRHHCTILNKENPWRVRYGELIDTPVDQYPKEAYDYSLDDAVSTAEVWIAQETSKRGGRRDKRIERNFPGLDPLRNTWEQSRAALVLANISDYGLRTDARGVEAFAEEVRVEYERVLEELVEHGLVRREWASDRDGQYAYIRKHKLERFFTHVPPTAKNIEKYPSGTFSLTKSALVATGDPLLIQLSEWRALEKLVVAGDAAAREAVKPLVAAGLIRVDESKDTKEAKWRQWLAYLHPEQLDPDTKLSPRDVPRTDKYDPANNLEHRNDPIACVKLDADACDASHDWLMQLYAEFTSLGKALNTDVAILRRGTVLPIHTFFEVILETGRTSSSNPNVQNVRRLPGIRECFVPRPGYVFVDTDFPSLELWTLAQTCKWILGYSTLLDALNAGKDPHLQMACTILGISYDEAKRRKKEPVVSKARTAGKGVNFGAPGGLGKKTFAVYAYKSYGIRMTEAEAEVLIKQYHDTWIEMPAYFKTVNSWRSGEKKTIKDEKGNEKEATAFNIVQPWSGRLRARATYCAAANSPFQGLGSDVAKRALWKTFKACFGFSELGEADPLFGCRIVNFIHDQEITEAPIERAHAAGIRQAALMTEAAKEIMTDCVAMKVEATLTAVWSKKSVSWYATKDGGHTTDPKSPNVVTDENGEPYLVPWEPIAACADDVVVWSKMSDAERGEAMDKKNPKPVSYTYESTRAYLVKQEWSKRFIDEVLGAQALAA